MGSAHKGAYYSFDATEATVLDVIPTVQQSAESGLIVRSM